MITHTPHEEPRPMTTPPPGATLHLGGDAYAHPDLNEQLHPLDGPGHPTNLIPYPGNPRRGDQDAITASVRELGLYRAIIVQRSTGHVLAGNHTLHALTDLGATQVPVTWVDVDDTRAAAIVARDNRTSDLSSNDDDALLQLLAGLAHDDDLLALSGYDTDDLAALTAATGGPDPVDPPPTRVRQPTTGPGTCTLYHGNNLDVLAKLDPDSVDAIVCDPPYGIDFMGRAWDDYGAPSAFAAWCQTWAEACLRVLKPGGHLIAFGATRTHHRLMQGVEDAGFVIRDCGVWLYRSGFPKSLDVAKAIDRAAGVEREVIGTGTRANSRFAHSGTGVPQPQYADGSEYPLTGGPATDDAAAWEGWGTSLKPAIEPWVLARKPLSEATVTANVLRWGTGALNIDATRTAGREHDQQQGAYEGSPVQVVGSADRSATYAADLGRWPANVLTGEDDDDLRFFRVAVGQAADYPKASNGEKPWTGSHGNRYTCTSCSHGQYHANAAGCPKCGSPMTDDRGVNELHPTVKPLDLMAHLVRLVTPTGGTVLDPFAGTGTTGEAAVTEGYNAVLIEQHQPYLRWINARLDITPTKLKGVKTPKPADTEALAEPVTDTTDPDTAATLTS